MDKLYETDYVIKNQQGDFVRFSNGDIIIYGNRNEARYDTNVGEMMISCTMLRSKEQKMILKQVCDDRT